MTKTFLAAGFVLLLGLSPAIAGVRVVDGDTIVVDGMQYRLWGIDAPEGAQLCTRDEKVYGCGTEAAAHLRRLIDGKAVSCEARTTDRYRRTVAICRVGEVDLGASMVLSGWAVAFVRYSSDYVAQEQEARAAKRGLWSGTFDMPWDWRASQRAR
jgi:endonuclease YncB( thermonuclease family)